ncbi:MAG: hypothetical protein ACTHMU_05670 [Thermomicrobiales bacterium]
MNSSRRTLAIMLAAALGTGGATFVLIGVPTALIPNPWFMRMLPSRPLDWVFLALTTLLAAALGATYALPVACPLGEGKLTAGGILSFLAIGCPICNKVALLALGASGALTYFAPVQPFLGVAALGLLGWALAARLRAIHATTPVRLQPSASKG